MPSAGEAEGASGRCKRPLARLTLSKAPKPLAEELWRTGRRGAHIRKRNTARRAPPAAAEALTKPGQGKDPQGLAQEGTRMARPWHGKTAGSTLIKVLQLYRY